MKYLIVIFLVASANVSNAQEKVERKGFALSVNSKIDEALMTKEDLKNATFGVHSFYEEFVGRVGLKGFTIKYPGQKEIKIQGNKLNAEAIRALSKLKLGDEVVAYDAISQTDGDYRIEIRSPIIITIR